MELVTLYREQSKRDLKSARLLCKNKDYGNAAFLAQQAIEKALKCCMMKFNLVDKSPKRLRESGHRPVIDVIDKLEEYNNEFNPKGDVAPLYKSIIPFFLPVLRGVFKRSDGYIISDKELWKESLGMKLTSEEKENIQTHTGNELMRLIPYMQKIKNKAREANDVNNEFICQKIKKVHNNLKISQDVLNNILKNTPISLPKIEYSEMRAEFEKVLSDHISIPKNINEEDKERVGTFVIAMWVVAHSYTLLKITPHQELGRYPEEIFEDKSSTSLYEENSVQLHRLIEEVGKAIEKLYAMVDRVHINP